MPIRRSIAAWVAACVLVPTLAAARPACCIKLEGPKRPSCCAPMTAAAPKSCCKAPAAPRPESQAKDALAGIAIAAAQAVPHGSVVVSHVPAVAAARLARLGHRAMSPDDSPPDLLSLHPALLI